MKIKTTRFKNLKVFQGKSHLDNRGAFRELFSKNSIKEFNGVFWCMSKSKKNVLRGLHIQKVKNQAKYVSVIKGKIFDVAVDLRRKSKTFGKVFTIILSDKNSKSVFIPSITIPGSGPDISTSTPLLDTNSEILVALSIALTEK